MMERQITSKKSIAYVIVVVLDMIMLLLLFLGLTHFFPKIGDFDYATWWWFGSYWVATLMLPPLAYRRVAQMDLVMLRSSKTALLMGLLYFFFNRTIADMLFSWGMVLTFALLLLTLIVSRILGSWIVATLRRRGIDNCEVVFAGAGVNLGKLYEAMSDKRIGYHIHGYFENKESRNLGDKLPRLGDVKDTVDYLKKHKVDMLVCNIGTDREAEIMPIMEYCENNFIKYYTVPNIYNYLRRSMIMEFVGEMPVLAIRNEPLRRPWNRFRKRAFDIVCSGFGLLCLSIPFAVIAVVIKLKSPGPVLFKQKRGGQDGKEFICYKFRSMHVNDEADTKQATEDDPRKYPFGNWMRKHNVDELPQLINVFKGDMSLVGPRPHMHMHDEYYGNAIKGYSVRRWVKPGITGWAQVNGYRGETKKMWQMEERVVRDIWYLENWSFFLDIRIIFKTIFNTLRGEKEAY
ncbi:MAG: undecaprenyl-phosphate glucose phosphotransferase [Bacteroidales bacterium]|nr:undecaprenyl-phosphate glucose phosphotransferase [Bacteroidales bacterium]